MNYFKLINAIRLFSLVHSRSRLPRFPHFPAKNTRFVCFFVRISHFNLYRNSQKLRLIFPVLLKTKTRSCVKKDHAPIVFSFVYIVVCAVRLSVLFALFVQCVKRRECQWSDCPWEKTKSIKSLANRPDRNKRMRRRHLVFGRSVKTRSTH